MRHQRDFTFKVSTDTAQQQVVFARRSQLTDDVTMVEQESGTRLLAAATNVQISFGGVTTAKSIWIEAAGLIYVRSGEATTARSVEPLTTGTKAIYYVEGAATALWLENPSASAAVEVSYCICGA